MVIVLLLLLSLTLSLPFVVCGRLGGLDMIRDCHGGWRKGWRAPWSKRTCDAGRKKFKPNPNLPRSWFRPSRISEYCLERQSLAGSPKKFEKHGRTSGPEEHSLIARLSFWASSWGMGKSSKRSSVGQWHDCWRRATQP
jgi:hypothetical protein